MTNEIVYDARCGSEITATVHSMITGAVLNDATVKTEFNGVTIKVRANSDPDLILRDWSRAMNGYIDKSVGPYPNPTLSERDVANDARIEAENERRRQDLAAEYEARAAAKRTTLTAQLAAAPPMDVADDIAWRPWKDSNSDPYGPGVIVIRYAETWARLMQSRIANGDVLEEIALETSHTADVEGITGFMKSAAVSVLAQCWVHGDRLRKWHNRQWGIGEDVDGTVNPAIVTLGGAAGHDQP